MSLIKVDQNKLKEFNNSRADAERKFAYSQEADPLFFKSQRGECSVEEWQSKIAEIKARFPKV
jgi:hypothetical protein